MLLLTSQCVAKNHFHVTSTTLLFSIRNGLPFAPYHYYYHWDVLIKENVRLVMTQCILSGLSGTTRKNHSWKKTTFGKVKLTTGTLTNISLAHAQSWYKFAVPFQVQIGGFHSVRLIVSISQWEPFKIIQEHSAMVYYVSTYWECWELDKCMVKIQNRYESILLTGEYVTLYGIYSGSFVIPADKENMTKLGGHSTFHHIHVHQSS